MADASEVLAGLGFRPLGELGIPLRWAFREPGRLAGTNTYVVVERADGATPHAGGVTAPGDLVVWRLGRALPS